MKVRTVASVSLLLFLVAAPASAQNHAPYYVLDAFGGVHAGGGAPVVSPGTPYFGFDAAVGIEYIPVGTSTATGDGILVLDKFGGVHSGGALAAHSPGGSTPYFGFDAARAIVYRDVPPRAAGSPSKSAALTSSTYAVITSASIHAPDDGFLLVNATSNLWCFGVGGVRGEAGINVDGNLALSNYLTEFFDCSLSASDVTTNVGMTGFFPVSAGDHTIDLVGRRVSGALAFNFDASLITVLFVDQDGVGTSTPAPVASRVSTRPDGPESRRR